jgi:hypothetical protein
VHTLLSREGGAQPVHIRPERAARKTARALSACQGLRVDPLPPCLLASLTPCLLASLPPWLLDTLTP